MSRKKDNCIPAEMLGQIQKKFQEWGIFGKEILLEHSGAQYKICCDEHAFIIYKLNNSNGPKHHVPGWPVCLVDSDAIFEECSSPELGSDHFACGVAIEKWLLLVHELHSRVPNL